MTLEQVRAWYSRGRVISWLCVFALWALHLLFQLSPESLLVKIAAGAILVVLVAGVGFGSAAGAAFVIPEGSYRRDRGLPTWRSGLRGEVFVASLTALLLLIITWFAGKTMPWQQFLSVTGAVFAFWICRYALMRYLYRLDERWGFPNDPLGLEARRRQKQQTKTAA